MGGGTPSPVLDEPDQNVTDDVTSYTVSLLGAQGVGKSALISQFMTSECINTYERPKGKSFTFMFVCHWKDMFKFNIFIVSLLRRRRFC